MNTLYNRLTSIIVNFSRLFTFYILCKLETNLITC